ncbi:MAG: glycosyltransferase family 39 protein [candidate division WOR-3 bacterium]
MVRRKNISLWIFFVIYTILSLLLFDPKLFTGGDNAVYIHLAEAIVTGKGYKNIYLPDEPSHTQYPPGFPLLLAVPFIIFGKNILLFKILIFLSGMGALAFFYLLSRKIFPENFTILISLYLSVPIFIIYNHWILSEIPFLFFSLGALYFLLKFCIRKHFLNFWLASSFAIYAFFIRTAGISLILGFLLYLILKKEYKYSIIFLALFLLFFIPWEVRNAGIPDNTGYLRQLLAKNPYQMELGTINFSDFILRLTGNLIFYTFTILPQTLLPVLNSRIITNICGLIFLLFLIIGFGKRLKNFTIFEIYFILGSGVLLAWPQVWSSDRFLLPILPVLLIYLYTGFVWLQEKLKLKYFLWVITGLMIILNVIWITSQAKIAVNNTINYLRGNKYAGYPLDWRRYFEMIEYIQENIPRDKIILARKPEFIYLLSRHKSFCYPFTTNKSEIKEALKKADYVIFDRFQWTGTTMRYLSPVIQEHPQGFEIVYRTVYPEFYLLKIKKENL